MTRRDAQFRTPTTRLLVAGLVTVIAGCSSPGSSPRASVNRSTVSTTRVRIVCGWPSKAGKDTLNIAYPDTAATYWSTAYILAPAEHLIINGRFPNARYASFITYGPSGGANSVLTDRDITPDPGSTNPFTHGGRSGGRYTIEVRSDTRSVANSLSAVTSSTAGTPRVSAGTTTSVPVNAKNGSMPLGSGIPGERGVVTGTLIYRVYVSNIRNDDTGGGLPQISVLHADGTHSAVPTCGHPVQNPAGTAIVDANGPATNTPAPAQPVFIRPKKNATNLYPNPDNAYLATIAHHTPGHIVVVHAKAPTFPDTQIGLPVTGAEQVRYWSLCTDEFRKPYPVSFCVADSNVALDRNGSYTIVVSTPADRPANATIANGVTWLTWGSTAVDNLLLMRQMLAAKTFHEAAINLDPGALAVTSMASTRHGATIAPPRRSSGTELRVRIEPNSLHHSISAGL